LQDLRTRKLRWEKKGVRQNVPDTLTSAADGPTGEAYAGEGLDDIISTEASEIGRIMGQRSADSLLPTAVTSARKKRPRSNEIANMGTADEIAERRNVVGRFGERPLPERQRVVFKDIDSVPVVGDSATAAAATIDRDQEGTRATPRRVDPRGFSEIEDLVQDSWVEHLTQKALEGLNCRVGPSDAAAATAVVGPRVNGATYVPSLGDALFKQNIMNRFAEITGRMGRMVHTPGNVSPDAHVYNSAADDDTATLCLPALPLLTRTEIAMFLREPIVEAGERPCAFGSDCESIKLLQYCSETQKHHNGVSGSREPFILRELLLPKDRDAILEGLSHGNTMKAIMEGIQPARPCILCSRVITCMLSAAIGSGINKTNVGIIQNHYNAFRTLGEYSARVQFSAGPQYHGLIKPIVAYNREHYVPALHEVDYVACCGMALGDIVGDMDIDTGAETASDNATSTSTTTTATPRAASTRKMERRRKTVRGWKEADVMIYSEKDVQDLGMYVIILA
jgi:hypothetical protein